MNNISSSIVSDQINLELNQNQQSEDIVNQTSIFNINSSINENISIDSITDLPPAYSTIDNTNGHLNRQNRDRPPTYQDVINMDTLSGIVQYNRVVDSLEYRQGNFIYNQDEMIFRDIPINDNRISNRFNNDHELKCTFLSFYWIFIMYILKSIFLVWVFINIASYDQNTYDYCGYPFLFCIFLSLILENYFIKGVKKETRDLSLGNCERYHLILFTVKRISELIGLLFCSYMTKIKGQDIPIYLKIALPFNK